MHPGVSLGTSIENVSDIFSGSPPKICTGFVFFYGVPENFLERL